MRKAINISFNIFIARAAGQVGVFVLFFIAGHLVANSIGDLNLFISFSAVFSAMASVGLVYFQNEVSGNIENKRALFFTGIQLALILGCTLSFFSLALSELTFHEVILLKAIRVVSLVYPLLGMIAFLTYYFEGIGQPQIPSKMLSFSIFIQAIVFFILIQIGVEVLLSAAYTFIIIDFFLVIYLLKAVKEPLNTGWKIIKFSDLLLLFSKGLPMSFGVAIQKYLFSLIVLAISALNAFNVNIYTAISGLVFLLLLPQMGISHAASIFISQDKALGKDFIHCAILAVGYVVLIVVLLLIGLQLALKLLYNFDLPEDQLNRSIFSAILFFLAQSLLLFTLALARAFEIIKTPQLSACLALLAGLITSKIMAESAFDFINVVSLYLIGSTIAILKIVQRQTEVNDHFKTLLRPNID